MLKSRDSFIDYLKSKLENILTIETYQEHTDNLMVDALNIRFLNDRNIIGVYPDSLKEFLVSLDILTLGNETMTAERKAMDCVEKLLTALKGGSVIDLINNRKLAWDSEDLSFKDIPSDNYIHKNLTISIKAL